MREEEEGSTCPETPIERAGQCIAIRFGPWCFEKHDHQIPTNKWIFPFFDVERNPGISKCCDYIIFSSAPGDPSRLYVLLCELKSGKGKGKGRHQGVAAQIKNGRLIAEHIIGLVLLHGNVQKQPHLEFRGLILAGKAPRLKDSLRPPSVVRYETDDGTQLKFIRLRAGERYPLRIFCT